MVVVLGFILGGPFVIVGLLLVGWFLYLFVVVCLFFAGAFCQSQG